MRAAYKFSVLGIFAIFILGCGEGKDAQDNAGFITDEASGIKYADVVEGRGEPCEYHDLVAVHYTTWLSNGKEINSSRDGDPSDVRLGAGGVIRGWDLGIPGMKVGGKRKLIIPPNLAFGDQGKPWDGIPPKAEITVLIELVSIKDKARSVKKAKPPQ